MSGQPMTPEPCDHHWIHYGQPSHSPIRWIVKCSQCNQFNIAALQEEVRAIRAEALREAANSGLFVGPIADMLEARADQIEGDE